MKKWLWKMYRFWNPYQQITLYDHRTNHFIMCRFAQDNGIMCGGFCRFYDDAKTSTHRQVLSYDYLWGCRKVGAIDKFPFAEQSLHGFYRVKER